MLATFLKKTKDLWVLTNGQYIARKTETGWMISKLDIKRSGPLTTEYVPCEAVFSIEEANYWLSSEVYGFVGNWQDFCSATLASKEHAVKFSTPPTGRELIDAYCGQQINGYSDEQVVEFLRRLFMRVHCLMCPVMKRSNSIYFFNEEEKWTKAPLDSDFGRMFFSSTNDRVHFDPVTYFGIIRQNIWHKAILNLKEGDTLRDALRNYLSERLEINPVEMESWPLLERLIQKVEQPVFEKKEENKDIKTFDWISVEVCLARYLFPSWDELKTAISKHRRAIDQYVLRSVSQSRYFDQYGVSVADLKVTSLTLSKDRSLLYVIEKKS